MNRPQPESRLDRFWQSLLRLDRGGLAALRHGLGQSPGMVAEMHRYVAWALPDEHWTWRNQTYYLAAALFAWHPAPKGTGNLGDAFRRVYEGRRQAESIERRFVALLNSHRDDLQYHLRQAIGLARSADVPIDWPQLHRDIIYWDHESGRTKREWARAFWGQRGTPPPENETSAQAITERSPA